MKKFLSLFFFLQILSSGTAQTLVSPYKLSLTIDIPISSNAVGLLTGSYMQGGKFNLPTKESISLLDRSAINKFDRGATGQYSKAAGAASDVALYTSIALPLLMLIDRNSRKDFGKVAVISVEAFALNLAITELFKETAHRKRPLLYNPDVPMAVKYKKDNFNSFISGHTSTVACMSFCFAKTYADYNPHSKLRPLIWALSAALPATTGLLRFKGGKHFWTDVIAGYIVGAVIGVTVPYMHGKNLIISR